MGLRRLVVAALSATAFVGTHALIVPRCETEPPTTTATTTTAEPTPPVCTNFIENYSFEDGGTGWTIATGAVKAGDVSVPAQHEDNYVCAILRIPHIYY